MAGRRHAAPSCGACSGASASPASCGTLVCAWFGSDLLGDNPVTVGVFSLFWIGGQLLERGARRRVAAGRPVRPPRRAGRRGGAAATGRRMLWWLPALVLATFGWTWLAWPDGLRPRSIGWWLAGYTAVMVVGALVGGRGWVRRHEAFGVAFGLLADGEPDRLERPAASPAQPADLARAGGGSTGVRARCSPSLVGIALFDAVSYTQWWADLLGVRSLDGYTAFNTLGLAWLVGDRGDRVDRGRPRGRRSWPASGRARAAAWPRPSPRWPPGTPRRTRSARC